MALSNAVKFVKQIGKNETFRNECYESKSKSDLLNKLNFNEYEFDEAINMNLVKCQTLDEADQIFQIKLWFALL